MLKFSIDDKKLLKRLDKIADNTPEVAEEVVKNLGGIAHKSARSKVPVDTGALKQSISLEVDGNGEKTVAEVGTALEYGPYVEYGTTSQKPQPYLKPALEDARKAASETLKAVWNKYAK